MMTIPALVFGILLSTLYGAAFHLWKGGGVGRFLLYIVLGWIGFWVGQLIGAQLGWTFASIGPLHIGTATVFSALFLLVGYWLSLIEFERE